MTVWFTECLCQRLRRLPVQKRWGPGPVWGRSCPSGGRWRDAGRRTWPSNQDRGPPPCSSRTRGVWWKTGLLRATNSWTAVLMDGSNCLVTIDLTNKSVPIEDLSRILRPPNHRLKFTVQATVVLDTHDETQQPHLLDNVDHLPELQLWGFWFSGRGYHSHHVSSSSVSVQWPDGMSSLPLLFCRHYHYFVLDAMRRSYWSSYKTTDISKLLPS